MSPGPRRFYDRQTQQSQVKTRITVKYFQEWSRVMLPQRHVRRLTYMDQLCGPGAYADGTPSTPLQVLDIAIRDARLRRRLVTIFNDSNATYIEQLQRAVDELPGVDHLTHQPQLSNETVGGRIADLLSKVPLAPTLLFADPWGYKGLSMELFASVLKDWGCDCIFFFNFNRLNAAITNEKVEEHVDALFGVDRANNLRARLRC